MFEQLLSGRNGIFCWVLNLCTSFFIVLSYSVLAFEATQESMSEDYVIMLVFALRRVFTALHY